MKSVKATIVSKTLSAKAISAYRRVIKIAVLEYLSEYIAQIPIGES
jgi:hypothetical protein